VDPNPSFHFDAELDPDLTVQFDADPAADANLRPLFYKPSTATFLPYTFRKTDTAFGNKRQRENGSYHALSPQQMSFKRQCT
jgi:hypothetical protein